MDNSRRDTIFGADDIATEVVVVPEWDDVDMELKAMTGKERILLVEGSQSRDKGYMYSDILISQSFIPDSPDKVFDKADREALANKSGGVLERLAMKVMELSGVDIDEAEAEVEADPTSVGV